MIQSFNIPKISRLAGEGVYGKVYEAYNELGIKIALKVVPQDDLESFVSSTREIAALIKCKSIHNVPKILGIWHNHYIVGQMKHYTIYAMEWGGNKTLQDIVLNNSISNKTLCFIAARVAQIVAQIHSVGIVHRDIKLDNILLNNEGNPILCDFGLATVPDLRHDGLMSGTAGAVVVRPPELLQGSEDNSTNRKYDYKTDIWMLGVVLFELATGDLPAMGDNIARQRLAICKLCSTKTRQKLWSMLSFSVSEGFADIVMSCLSIEPNDRPDASVVASQLFCL